MVLKNPKTDGNEHLNDPEADPDEEVMGVRYLESHGTTYTIEADGQYALWRVKPLTGGVLPKELKDQQWTSAQEAEQAIEAYQRGKNFKSDAPKPTRSA